ncbi:hypothetical protein MLD38_022554 [Melastoma candidum]|uniref:Uncharacterized protein n=1 Tax=Melastoma candidum TaxID=119954 RepID=A0ACB9QMN4_9MYRT|nr:hypothetical protein MLD38_022554 [Melastoma candidum]
MLSAYKNRTWVEERLAPFFILFFCCGSSSASEGGETSRMGRGVSSGGGQSSLGYLLGGGGETADAARVTPKSVEQTPSEVPAKKVESPPSAETHVPAGIQGSQKNNYFRAEGQNCGNFITDRPSTKVHAAPGGGSSLDYLFGDAKK